MKIPIVVVAYNRPNSLKRILNSVGDAYYPNNKEIELIISIDYSGENHCLNEANNFIRKYGKKTIINHSHNRGLRNHIIQCGDISLVNDGVIILEDDCFVSKDFYNYVYKIEYIF